LEIVNVDVAKKEVANVEEARRECARWEVAKGEVVKMDIADGEVARIELYIIEGQSENGGAFTIAALSKKASRRTSS
jgi:hypothetical protein